HHSSNRVNLFVIPKFQEFAVAVRVFLYNTVTHGKLHKTFVKDKFSLRRKLLKFTERNTFGPRTLNNLHDTKLSILGTPAIDKVFCVIWVIPNTAHIVLGSFDKGIKVIIHIHHVKNCTGHHNKRSLIHELHVLFSESSCEL